MAVAEPKIFMFPMEGLFGVVRPSKTHKQYNYQYLNDFLRGNGLGIFFFKLVTFTFRHISDRLKFENAMFIELARIKT